MFRNSSTIPPRQIIKYLGADWVVLQPTVRVYVLTPWGKFHSVAAGKTYRTRTAFFLTYSSNPSAAAPM